MKKSITTNNNSISSLQSHKKSSINKNKIIQTNNYTSSSHHHKFSTNQYMSDSDCYNEISSYDELSNELFINSPVYTVQKQNSLTWCYSITPIHLKGLDIICKIFGRSRYTVKQWSKEGAPIVFDGISYISEYNALFGWLLDRYR